MRNKILRYCLVTPAFQLQRTISRQNGVHECDKFVTRNPEKLVQKFPFGEKKSSAAEILYDMVAPSDEVPKFPPPPLFSISSVCIENTVILPNISLIFTLRVKILKKKIGGLKILYLK